LIGNHNSQNQLVDKGGTTKPTSVSLGWCVVNEARMAEREPHPAILELARILPG
jgi:hypothetical protein